MTRTVKNWRTRPWAPPLTPKQMEATLAADDEAERLETMRLRAQVARADTETITVPEGEVFETTWNGLSFFRGPGTFEVPRQLAYVWNLSHQQIADDAPPGENAPFGAWEEWLKQQGVDTTKRRAPDPTRVLAEKYESFRATWQTKQAALAEAETLTQTPTLRAKIKRAQALLAEILAELPTDAP